MRVLDIGCGTAPYKPIFTRLGCEYIGCDLKSEDDQSEVNVFIAPGEKIPLEDASADMVVSFEVLEHVADVDFYLSECRRLLKQGGYCYFLLQGYGFIIRTQLITDGGLRTGWPMN
jgi:SAM-dependent methyltransferase